MNLLLFILASTGLTSLIVDGKIFDKIRPSWKMLKCYQCVGFHSGYVMFVLFWVSGICLSPNPFVGWFIYACLGSWCSYCLGALVDDEGLRINRK